MFVKIQNLSLETALLNHYLPLSQNLKINNFVKQKPQQEFISNILNYFPLYDCCINVNEILFVLNRYKSFQVSCCIIGNGVKIIASTEVDFCKLIISVSGHSENTVYLERPDSCVNIHVLRQVALLSETFSTDLARELLVRTVNLTVSAA